MGKEPFGFFIFRTMIMTIVIIAKIEVVRQQVNKQTSCVVTGSLKPEKILKPTSTMVTPW